MLEMNAQPIVPGWNTKSDCDTNGAELQRAIIRGFTDLGDPIWSSVHKEFVFEKEFTFKEHGEFFRGASTMANIRFTRNFYELLQRYERIKVVIRKVKHIDVSK